VNTDFGRNWWYSLEFSLLRSSHPVKLQSSILSCFTGMRSKEAVLRGHWDYVTAVWSGGIFHLDLLHHPLMGCGLAILQWGDGSCKLCCTTMLSQFLCCRQLCCPLRLETLESNQFVQGPPPLRHGLIASIVDRMENSEKRQCFIGAVKRVTKATILLNQALTVSLSCGPGGSIGRWTIQYTFQTKLKCISLNKGAFRAVLSSGR